MLKMNILPLLQEPLKELITIQLEDNTFSPTTSKTKDVFNFLKWKQNRLPKYFSMNERNILSYNQFNRFYELSSLACSYSKPLMRLCFEHLWQILLNSQYQIEGCTEVPNANSEKLVFPPNTTRLLETLVMSLFYPNNLLFDFLNRYNPIKFPYKTCPCGSGIQDSIHLLMNCIFVNSEKRNNIAQILLNNKFHQIDSVSDQKSLLLSWSRFPGFIELCCFAINDVSGYLLTEVKI